jgi:RNA polymerase sigma-70 factor (ECF subfamily)
MRSSDHASDAALLAATDSDPLAFAAFYDRYERPLVAYFVARTRDVELAADLTAEVFASVLEHAEDFDSTRSSADNAAPWLFAIARNTLLKSLRQGRVIAAARQRLGMAEPFGLEDDGYARIEALASIETELGPVIAALPSEQRVALLARVVEERDYGEIAQQLQCSELVVRKRVSRALAALRSALPRLSQEDLG